MKKIFYLTIVGGALMFASCQNGAAPDAAKMQATMDSTVNAKMEPVMADLNKACDENIMKAAADSAAVMMDKAKKGTKKAVAHTPVKHVEPPKSTTPPPNTNMGKKTDANAAQGTNTGKKTDATANQGQNLGKKRN